jgi:protein gp37
VSDGSKIEWTDATWNPVTGCTKVSAGCDHCYAETFAERWRGTPGHHFENGFDVTLRPERLDQPLRWKRPRMIFVNSMSDLFHEAIPDLFIEQIFGVMEQATQHTFQVLTKRHARMRSFVQARERRKQEYAAKFDDCPAEAMRNSPAAEWARQRAVTPPANIWLGVSAEDQHWAETRVHALLSTPAAVRWVSAEPLLGPIDLRNLKARNGALIDALCGDVKTSGGEIYAACPGSVSWVVAGGESGAGARPMCPDWARSLRDQCQSARIPYLFKQWGAWAPTGYVGAGGTDPREIFVRDSTVTCHDWEGAQLRRVGKTAAGRVLDGRTWDEFPPVAARAVA